MSTKQLVQFLVDKYKNGELQLGDGVSFKNRRLTAIEAKDGLLRIGVRNIRTHESTTLVARLGAE